MPIVGFASTLFGVEDVAKCTQFFEDLGLPLFEKNERESHFRLDDGSNLVLRKLDDPFVPKSVLTGYGLKEASWGSTPRRVSTGWSGTCRRTARSKWTGPARRASAPIAISRSASAFSRVSRSSTRPIHQCGRQHQPVQSVAEMEKARAAENHEPCGLCG